MAITRTVTGLALLAAAITSLSAPALAGASKRPLTDWVGSWIIGREQTIDISIEDGAELIVDGYATYGALDADRVAQGSVHVASFFARIPAGRIEGGNAIRFAYDGEALLPFDIPDGSICKVELVLEWPKLRAHDNGRCGGANASFTGLYSAPYKR